MKFCNSENPWVSPVIPWDDCTPKRKDVLRKLWAAGDLRYKLDPLQKTVYDRIKVSWGKVTSSAERLFCMDMARQLGKDQIMVVMAHEVMARCRHRRIPYGAPTQTMVVDILEPIVQQVQMDCPPELRPQEKRTKHQWEHPITGTKLVLVGCDYNPQRLRGPGAVALFLTEAGFIKDLDTEVLPAVLSQLITYPDAFQVYASTPPTTPAHPWSTTILPDAQGAGMSATHILYECPRITPVQAEGFIRKMGGKESTRARREYFCEHVLEETLAIIPEWRLVKDQCVVKNEPPQFCDCYTFLDPGYRDRTGVVFGYYDFARSTLVIQKSLRLCRANTIQIAETILQTEIDLWGSWRRWSEGRFKEQPYLRVIDPDPRLSDDLATQHKLWFSEAPRTNLESRVNRLRTFVQDCRVEIWPEATELIAEMDFGVWQERGRHFARAGEFGHFDCLAALICGVSMLQTRRNPIPPHGIALSDTEMYLPPQVTEQTAPSRLRRAVLGSRKVTRLGAGRLNLRKR